MSTTHQTDPGDSFRRNLEMALAPRSEASEPELELSLPAGQDSALLEEALRPSPENDLPSEPLDRFLGRVTRAYVAEILRRMRGSRSATARVLGIDRTTLYRLMKRHSIPG